MRVGYLTYGLDRAPAGIARYALELLRALAAMPGGPEMVLLTTEASDKHDLWGRFEHHALPGCRRLPALMTAGNLALSWAARRYRLDLIHDPNSIAPFLGPRGGARRVVTVHDAFAYVQPETQNRLDNWRFRYMLPHALPRADRVLTGSEQSRSDLAQHLALTAANLQVIPYGVDPRFSAAAEPTDGATVARHGLKTPYLLYLGGLNARKNVARLIEAFALVRQTHPQLTLAIGGARQWQTGALDAALRRPELAQSVQLLGYVPDDDLPALYRGATAFVFPSLYEGFGLPVLEALACGTPVVTSNTTSLPEVAGDAALLVDPYSVPAIAAAILRLLDEPGLSDDLRARGPIRARQFTWPGAACAVMGVYRQLLGQEAAA